jgi:hypothetical protein
MVDERGTGLAIAGQDVEHPVRNARLERQFAEPHRGKGSLLGRLE